MGQLFSSEEVDQEHQETKNTDGVFARPFQQSPKRPRANPLGTDATIQSGDLLKTTDKELSFDAVPPTPTTQKLPFEDAYYYHSVFSAAECLEYISLSEGLGFEVSPIRDLKTPNSDTFRYNTSYRSSLRVLFDAPPQMAQEMNKRLYPLLPRTLDLYGDVWDLVPPEEGQALGPVNRRWRFNRYDAGDFFKPHYDYGYDYSDNEKTLLTLILYLSEGFDGGETVFFPGNRRGKKRSEEDNHDEYKVVPKIGSALVFWQTGPYNPLHEGAVHNSPNTFKYILRSDIAYRRISVS